MAVPLLVSGSVVGLIYLDSLLGAGQFTADDLKLLRVMANYANLGVERARRAKTEADERLREDERNEAAAIQRQFLPAAPPMVPHLDLAAYNAPCRTVGGDYYDFITHPESVAVALGDVSGKGMPAALMMMGLQARVQALTGKPQGPAKLVTRVNRFTGYNCPSNQFITFFFCTLNPSSGNLAYCNAGHNPPMLARKSGAIVFLEGGGPVIGVLKNYKYQEFRTVMEPSDVLVIYSDGVTEATDSREDEYGEERLQTILRESRTGTADEILDAINAHLDVFRAGTPARDDITLVVVKRLQDSGTPRT
jgi:serine phosphatase RsbU (regulator of sigma subunit)